MSALSPAARAVVQLMAQSPRGPKRDGCFAVWLTLRLVEDLSLDPPQPAGAVRRRVSLLERRLTSLSLTSPLRRGLGGVLAALPDAGRKDAPTLLAQLVACARDGLGPEAGEALSGKRARA
jgi:hypothetical protein